MRRERRQADGNWVSYEGDASRLTVSLSIRSTFIPAPLSDIIRDMYCLTASTTSMMTLSQWTSSSAEENKRQREGERVTVVAVGSSLVCYSK